MKEWFFDFLLKMINILFMGLGCSMMSNENYWGILCWVIGLSMLDFAKYMGENKRNI